MRSLLDTESKRQREGGGRRESPKPGSLYKVQSWLNWGTQRDDSYLRCSLAWVRREQKAAAKEARFGAHFTQIITFSAF